MLYFAAASWSEVLQRIRPSQADAWTGFLGVDDPQLATLPQDSLDLLELMKETAELDDATVGRFTRWVADAIEGRNVAGLCDPTKSNLFAADTQDIVRSAALLGMSRDAVVQALPKLRGSARP